MFFRLSIAVKWKKDRNSPHPGEINATFLSPLQMYIRYFLLLLLNALTSSVGVGIVYAL